MTDRKTNARSDLAILPLPRTLSFATAAKQTIEQPASRRHYLPGCAKMLRVPTRRLISLGDCGILLLDTGRSSGGEAGHVSGFVRLRFRLPAWSGGAVAWTPYFLRATSRLRIQPAPIDSGSRLGRRAARLAVRTAQDSPLLGAGRASWKYFRATAE